MKLKNLWLASLAIAFWSIQNLSAVEHFDPELEDWLKQKTDAAHEARADVLVYFYKDSPRDYGSLPTLMRVQENQILAEDAIEAGLKEIDHLLPLQNTDIQLFWSAFAAKAEVTKASLKKLKKLNSIQAIIADSYVFLDEPMGDDGKVKTDESKMTYGLQLVNAPSAWEQGYTGKGVKVGIIDTGIDLEHPDLQGKVLTYKDFTNDKSISDNHGHGTHVAGTIAGGDASGIKIGVAPDAELIVAKVFNAKGRATKSGILGAMEWMINPDGDTATDDAPRVVSNSWGNASPFEFGFRYAVWSWREAQIFPNFAAGNSGFFLSIGAPARYPYAYAVGAMDEFADVTSFSSKGPSIWWGNYWFKLFTKPEISAPGHYVYSSVPGEKWKRYSGTSMATPHVSGIIALALEANADLTVEDLMEIMNSSALDKNTKGMDNRSGYGLIQADRIVEKARSWKKRTHLSSQDKAHKLWEWLGL